MAVGQTRKGEEEVKIGEVSMVTGEATRGQGHLVMCLREMSQGHLVVYQRGITAEVAAESKLLYPPQTVFVRWYVVFMLSIHPWRFGHSVSSKGNRVL